MAEPARRILVVDDQPELVRALGINLRARQYDVLTAGTGREALALAASHPPDAIILDLGLPDIDGTEVIVELRRWSANRTGTSRTLSASGRGRSTSPHTGSSGRPRAPSRRRSG